jgi:hypothetical protein
MAGIGMVLLALWLVLWLLLKPLPEPARRPSAADRAEKIVGALPPGNRVRVELRGDQLSVSGYVDSDARQRDLVAAFRAEVPEANLRVWSTPRLAETARSFLADRKLDLKVEAGDPGELTISGSVPSGPLWTTARQMLLAEVPGLQKITDEVRIAGDKPAEKGPAAAAPRSPDAGYKVVAVQTLPEGPAWVRLSDGSVLFAGGRLGAAATFTGVEKGKARFDSPAGTVLAGVGETISLPPSPPPRPAAPDAATRSATPLRDVPEPRPAPASPLPSAQTPAAPAEGPPAASGASAVVPPPGPDTASAENSAPAANPPATPAPAPALAEPPPGPSGAPAAPPAGADAAPSANPAPGANPPVTPAPEAAPTEVPAPPAPPAHPGSPSTSTPPPSTETPAAPPRPTP